MKSFRTRILLWILGVFALVLLALGALIDRSFYSMQLTHIDEGLRAVATLRPHPPGETRFWERYEEIVREESHRFLDTKLSIISYDSKNGTHYTIGELAGEELIGLLPQTEGELRERRPDELPPMFRRNEKEGGRDGRGRDRGVALQLEREWQLRGLRKGDEREVEYLFFDTSNGGWRFALFRDQGFNVAIGVKMERAMAGLTRLRRSFLVALPIALAVLGISAWFVSRKAIDPIVKLSAVAGSISASDLSVRIEKANEDREFAELISVFNKMLDRLEGSFAQAHRFSADAAHELKTPLAILQGHLENAIQSAPDGSDSQGVFGNLIEEVHRLKTISRKLLLLAQADTGSLPLHRENVEVNALLSQILEDFSEQLDGFEYTWKSQENASLNCDRSLLTQVIQNLLSNAYKYRTESSGPIELSLFEERNLCVFHIENQCEAMTEEQRAILFDRFTRIDGARNRKHEGTGLGLSLSREFARAHGGDLSLVDSESNTTIVFRLVIPRV